MNLPFFGKVMEGAQTVAVLDVGSGSVAGALISINRSGDLAEILAARRFELPQEGRTEEARRAGIIRLAKEAASYIGDAAHGPTSDKKLISSVNIIIHAPWSASETLRSSEVLKNTTRITGEFIQQIALKSLSGHTEVESSEAYERAIVRVELNGYSTAKPEGKSAKSVSVTALRSTAHGAFVKNLRSIAEGQFPGRPVHLRSAAYVLRRVLESSQHLTGNYTATDITSEAISFWVSNEGGFSKQGVVPFGARRVYADVEAQTGLRAEEVLSRLRMMSEGTCSDEACQPILAALAEHEGEYVRACGEVLTILAETSRLPNMLIIFASPIASGWAEQFFGKIDFAQFTQTGKSFVPRGITSRSVSSHVVYGKGVKEDSGVSIAAVFAQDILT